MLGNQAIDGDIPSLAYSVATILCLPVHGWVPVSVIEYHIAGPCQIQPYPSRSSGADEHHNSGIIVEPLNQLLPDFCFSPSIQPHIVEPEHVHDLLEDI